MAALIHREYLEHRGAFLYAPAALLGLFTLMLVGSLGFNRSRMPFDVGLDTALKFYEIAFFGLGALWFVYLMVTLFFYYADAFNADRRNNAMLFWKSMPLSDFKVLSSKMLAGMTLLPAAIFAMLMITGLVLYGITGLAVMVMPRLAMPGVLDIIVSSLQIGAFSLVHLVLALLWYAPFFAWVGGLSTLVGRWSIPLAFLIPAILGIVENLFVADTGPKWGYVLAYLRERMQFGFEWIDLQRAFFTDDSFNAATQISLLVARIDWSQLVGGLIFAALMVYLASEYRRRVLAT